MNEEKKEVTHKFKVGDLVFSNSWAASEGMLRVVDLPNVTSIYYVIETVQGIWVGYHAEFMMYKATKLHKALK